MDRRRRVLWLAFGVILPITIFWASLVVGVVLAMIELSKPIETPPGTIPHWTGAGINAIALPFAALMFTTIWGACLGAFIALLRRAGIPTGGTQALAWTSIAWGTLFLIAGFFPGPDLPMWRQVMIVVGGASMAILGVALAHEAWQWRRKMPIPA